MNPRRKIGVLIPALIAAAILGGYGLGRYQTEIDITATAAERTPLYYQDPSGKPDYSPTPKNRLDRVGSGSYLKAHRVGAETSRSHPQRR